MLWIYYCTIKLSNICKDKRNTIWHKIRSSLTFQIFLSERVVMTALEKCVPHPNIQYETSQMLKWTSWKFQKYFTTYFVPLSWLLWPAFSSKSRKVFSEVLLAELQEISWEEEIILIVVFRERGPRGCDLLGGMLEPEMVSGSGQDDMCTQHPPRHQPPH